MNNQALLEPIENFPPPPPTGPAVIEQHYQVQYENGDLIISPFDPTQIKLTVFFLGGIGAEPSKYLNYFIQAPFNKIQNIKYVIPAADPRLLTCFNKTYFSWFDIKIYDVTSYDKPVQEAFNEEDIESSFDRLKEMIETEAANLYEGDYSKILLTGFSQGGTMALYTALKLNYVFAHCIAIGACILKTTPVNKNVNFGIQIIHGLSDNIIPWAAAQRGYAKISGRSQYSEELYHNVGHTVFTNEIKQKIYEILDRLINNTTILI